MLTVVALWKVFVLLFMFLQIGWLLWGWIIVDKAEVSVQMVITSLLTPVLDKYDCVLTQKLIKSDLSLLFVNTSIGAPTWPFTYILSQCSSIIWSELRGCSHSDASRVSSYPDFFLNESTFLYSQFFHYKMVMITSWVCC